MLQSMTGFGTGRAVVDGTTVSVEVRSVNNRHLKVTVRGSEPYPVFETEFEKLVRRHARRGTVSILVRIERPIQTGTLKINASVVSAYLSQLAPLAETLAPSAAATLYSGVLSLPGVSTEVFASQSVPDEEWMLVERATATALEEMAKTRGTEGRQMAEELRSLVSQIDEQIARVKEHVPNVVADYRKRLHERISNALATTGATIDESNLIREIALYADRTDVAEEITRITGHLAAIEEAIRTGGEGAGRRLEFLAQELGREANTLGSKAGDAVISRHGIEIKAVLEKFRELVLNVE